MTPRPATQAHLLRDRCRRAYAAQRRRAHADGVKLDYDAAELEALAAEATVCAYCRSPLGLDFQFDHRTPIARGGKHKLANLTLCCSRCNRLKGLLTEWEFQFLENMLEQLHPAAAADLARRLLSGGTRYARRRT